MATPLHSTPSVSALPRSVMEVDIEAPAGEREGDGLIDRPPSPVKGTAHTPAWIRLSALATLIVQNSALALTMRYSRVPREAAAVPYLITTAVVSAESLKLCLSLWLLRRESGTTPRFLGALRKHLVDEPAEFAKLLIPAALYTLQNNLAYVAVSNLQAAQYQLLYQLKILTTAIFSVVLLRRQLANLQWVSLCVLVLGVGLVQTAGESSASADEDGQGNRFVGLMAVLAACFCSGLAGVYFEKVLKGAKLSIWMRNIQLALIGVVCGIFGAYTKDGDAIAVGGFFQGYDSVVLTVIALQAAGGLIVAIVIKYADNILKGFATSISVVLSCVVSFFLFDIGVTAQFCLGAALTLVAVYMYSYKPAG